MTRTMKFVATLVAFTSFVFCSTAQAVVLSFQGPIHDSTTLRQDIATTPQDDDPQFENFIGRGATNGMNSLYEFDLAALAAEDLGAGLMINSVTLTMYHRDNGDGGAGTFTAGIHEYGFDFIEGAATWSNPAGDGSDTTGGGTFGTLLSSTVITNPSGTADLASRIWNSTPAFVTAVENALATDNALRLLAADISNTSLFDRVYDETQGLNAPLLQIDFTANSLPVPIPEPSSALLLSLGMLGLIRYARRRRQQV